MAERDKLAMDAELEFILRECKIKVITREGNCCARQCSKTMSSIKKVMLVLDDRLKAAHKLALRPEVLSLRLHGFSLKVCLHAQEAANAYCRLYWP